MIDGIIKSIQFIKIRKKSKMSMAFCAKDLNPFNQKTNSNHQKYHPLSLFCFNNIKSRQHQQILFENRYFLTSTPLVSIELTQKCLV